MRERDILLIVRKRRESALSKYLPEILWAEGIVNFECSSSCEGIEDYVIVITHAELSQEEWSRLEDYVSKGGRLISIRPPSSQARIFGLKPLYRKLSDYRLTPKYIGLDYTSPITKGLPNEVIQLVSEADIYECAGAEPIVYMYFCRDRRTEYPAISINRYGEGIAVAYSYDLTECVVNLRQGRRENTNRDIDGCGALKPNDLFIGMLDPRLKWIPQADLHMRLFSRILEHLFNEVKPLLRLWYFPKGASNVVIMTGDSDVMSSRDLEVLRSLIRKYNAQYTLFMRPEDQKAVPSDLKEELAREGISLGLHTFPGFMPSIKEAEEAVREQSRAHERAYGRALTHRGHCTIWIGWVEMAKILKENGIKMDLSYYPYRYFQAGYLNSSGLPMKFIDEEGNILDIYEQSTHWADDVTLTDKTFVDPYTIDELIKDTLKTIEESARIYHTALTFCIHPINMRPSVLNSVKWMEAVLAYCRAKEVPVLSANYWLEFNEMRRSITVERTSLLQGKCIIMLRVSKRIENITLLLPTKFRDSRIKRILVNGNEQKYCIKEFLGKYYAAVFVDLEPPRATVELEFDTNV